MVVTTMVVTMERRGPTKTPFARLLAVCFTRWEYLGPHGVIADMSGKYLSKNELEIWQRLQTVTESLRREVGRGLKQDAGLSEAEFVVLAHLMDAGGAARPSECAESIGWDSSRLAHQLGRLERRGLVRRAPEHEGDGRASTASLTDAGYRAHRKAVGPHLRAAKRWFADALTDAQLSALGEALTAIEDNAARAAKEKDK
jgi:DNA-binding MarR family transcriptional regulator